MMHTTERICLSGADVDDFGICLKHDTGTCVVAMPKLLHLAVYTHGEAQGLKRGLFLGVVIGLSGAFPVQAVLRMVRVA